MHGCLSLPYGIYQSLIASSPQVERFVEEVCIPADTVYAAQLGSGDERWHGHPSIMEDLKDEARKRGLFNMFLPKNHFKEGAGFSNIEYGLMAEQLGKSRTASEVCHTAIATVCVQLKIGWIREPDGPTMMLIPACAGHQLRCTRYRQYGSHCQIRHSSSERQVA
jgi:alkylation response protein AidB-like acyl-CoA dehydrogenase